MNTLDMISEPLAFVEDLREHTGKVCQTVELIPALLDAMLTADDEQARRLHGQMLQIKTEADRLKSDLYDRFQDLHFRAAGEYATGEYISSMDKMTEAAEEFADAVVSRQTAIPGALHPDLRTLADRVVQIGRQLSNLASVLWPPEEAVPVAPKVHEVLDQIDRIGEANRRVKQLETEFARRLYSLKGQLDSSTLLYLNRCTSALRAIATDAELAADHLRMVVR